MTFNWIWLNVSRYKTNGVVLESVEAISDLEVMIDSEMQFAERDKIVGIVVQRLGYIK